MARKDHVAVYKPNSRKQGSALQLKLGSERSCMFLELAPQAEGPNPFDWTNRKIIVKLGPSDIGKLLVLFNRVFPPTTDETKPDLQLFHKNPKGNKIIKIKHQENGYYMKVSASEGGKNNAIAIPITWDEVELIKIALNRGYEIMLGW